MLFATSLSDAAFLVIFILFLVVICIQLVLPRIVSSNFSNFTSNSGQWRISVSLYEPIRISFFCERLIRIDVFGLKLVTHKQADRVFVNKKSNSASHQNLQVIAQAVSKLVAIRFHKTDVQICPEPSISMLLSIPLMSVMGVSISRSFLDSFVETHSLRLDVQYCNQSVAKIMQNNLSIQLNVDIFSRRVCGISIHLDRAALKTELNDLRRLQRFHSSSKSDRSKSDSTVNLPDRIHLSLAAVQLFVSEFEFRFDQIGIRAKHHKKSFGSCIETQTLIRNFELRQSQRSLLLIGSVSLHSGHQRRALSTANNYVNGVRTKLSGVELHAKLDDIDALYALSKQQSEHGSTEPTSAKGFSLPLEFAVEAHDSLFTLESSSMKISHITTKLFTTAEAPNVEQYPALMFGLSNAVASIDHQLDSKASVASVQTLIEFQVCNGVLRPNIALRVHHLNLAISVLLIGAARRFSQRFRGSGSSPPAADRKYCLSFDGREISFLLTMHDRDSDLMRTARLHLGTLCFNFDQRLRLVVVERAASSTAAVTKVDPVDLAHELTSENDCIQVSRANYSDGSSISIVNVDVQWSIPFHTTLLAMSGALRSSSAPASSTKSSTPISIEIESGAFLFNIDKTTAIAANADQISYSRDPDSSMTFRTSSGAVAVNGAEFLSWSSMLYLNQFHDPFPDLDLEFTNLVVFLSDSISIGPVIETVRRKWRALKLWQRSAVTQSSKQPSTLEFRCICLRIDTANVIFEENPLERTQLYRRWIALNPAGRRRYRRTLHRCRDATLHANNIQDNERIKFLRRSSMYRTKSSELPSQPRNPSFDFNPNLDPLDDPFMDRFDQLQLLASDKTQWALAVLQIGQLCLSLSPEHGITSSSAAVARMASLDSVTHPPYDAAGSGREFSEIWSRNLQVSCHDVILKLRDYPFPLISFHHSFVKGHLASACLKSPELFRYRRCVFLPLAHNRRTFAPVDLPDGSAVPNKFFIDVHAEATGLELNYGQCQRGALAAFTKAVSKITDTGWSTSRSPSLAWWDQLRYKIHGRIGLGVKQLTVRILTSPDPYHDECILLLAESSSLDLFKGRWSLNARHFQINLDEGSASRSNISRPGLLLACPYLRVLLLFSWTSKADDPSQHYVHHVAWQSEQYKFSSTITRDLYEDFRARSVAMKIKVHCLALEAVDGAAPVVGPLVSFWFCNVPWLKQVYQLYSNPPNVCSIVPKILIGPNRALTPVKSGNSLSGLLSQIKLEISLASTVIELIAEPQKDRSITVNNDNDILGIQGFSQLMRFGADLDVISDSFSLRDNSSRKKKWVWSKQRARSVHSSIDILVPYLSTLTSDNLDEHIKDVFAHPLSQTPFATGEGDSSSMFFMSADSLSYCSPSAGGKYAVNDLVELNDSALFTVQASPSGKTDPSSLAQSTSNQSLTAEEVSVQRFLQLHFGELSISSSDDDSRCQILNLTSLSDVEIDNDFESDLRESGDRLNREHYVLVSGIRVLWNNSIRAAFNDWWSFLSSFGHSESSTTARADSTTIPSGSDPPAPKSIKHYATWSGRSDVAHRSLSRPENAPRRLTSFELFQKLDERGLHPPNHDDTMMAHESPTPGVLTDDDGAASLKSHDDAADDPEAGHTRFAMRLQQPQVILQSVEVGCSVVISAHQAKVDVIAFPYYFPECKSPISTSPFVNASPAKPLLERKSSSYFSTSNRPGSGPGKSPRQSFIYFKKTIRSRLDQAQLHVVPNNIDIDSNAMEWIPLEDFPAPRSAGNSLGQEQDFVSEETASCADQLYQNRYLKSNGIFQRISEPTSLGFDYCYDVNMDTKDPAALEHQFEHRSTASESLQQDDDDIDDPDLYPFPAAEPQELSLPILTSSSRLYISKINFVMDSLQCKVLMSVIDKLVLSTVQHVWATARALQAARRTTADGNPDPKELQKLASEALAHQQNQPESRIFRRCISYEILGATWTLITQSPEVFLHVQLRRLHGSHRYRIGDGRDVEFGLKEFRIRNLATNALWPDVVAPHHRWDAARGSSELMLRVRAQVLGWPSPYARRLRDVTAWDHFDIKVFPLIIKVQAQHYSCTRDYFFPGKEPTPAPSTSQLLSQSHVVLSTSSSASPTPPAYIPYTNRQRKAVMTLRRPVLAANRSAEVPSVTSSILNELPPTPVQIINYNYLKYFHISELEFHIYFRGSFIDLDDLHVLISAFSCNGELWTWDKLVSKIETHVQTSVLKQSKSLIKQKFSSSVKSLAEKEHKIRDRFTAKFGRKHKEEEISEMSQSK